MTPDDLKAWRARMGWTQQKAADEMGMTKRNYQFLEAGRHTITRPVERLCRLLEAHPPD